MSNKINESELVSGIWELRATEAVKFYRTSDSYAPRRVFLRRNRPVVNSCPDVYENEIELLVDRSLWNF